MDGWTETGTIAAVAAAVAAVVAIGLSWYYGHRAVADSGRALRYERLREARDLINTIRVTADNSRFMESNEAAAKLRAVLVTLDGDLVATRKLANTEWGHQSYTDADLQGTVTAARAELEGVVASLARA